MSDFHQHGLVPTLHRLGEPDPARMDKELADLARDRPLAVILPCHGRDLVGPAFARILDTLETLRFPSALVLATNDTPPDLLAALRTRLAGFHYRTGLLAADRPALLERLCSPALARLGAGYPGKGLNLWLGLAWAADRAGSHAVLAHDADIGSYNADLPLRLAFPVVHPELGYAFAKGYYHRATDRLYGRVTRLFFLPLLEALLRVAGHHPLLDFLAGFRYPLAGEFAATTACAGSLRWGNGYTVETVQLCELHRTADPETVCQVDIGPNYEHRHQPLESGGGGLAAMANSIATTLLTELADEGTPLPADAFPTLRETYLRTAATFVRRYAHVARLNGLASSLETDNATLAPFAEAIPHQPLDPLPLLPAWNTLHRLSPTLRADLLDAAEAG